MPLRNELLNLCQRIKDEQDRERLQALLDELSLLLEQEKAAIAQRMELHNDGESKKAKSA
jgi:hypothetical protein